MWTIACATHPVVGRGKVVFSNGHFPSDDRDLPTADDLALFVDGCDAWWQTVKQSPHTIPLHSIPRFLDTTWIPDRTLLPGPHSYNNVKQVDSFFTVYKTVLRRIKTLWESLDDNPQLVSELQSLYGRFVRCGRGLWESIPWAKRVIFRMNGRIRALFRDFTNIAFIGGSRRQQVSYHTIKYGIKSVTLYLRSKVYKKMVRRYQIHHLGRMLDVFREELAYVTSGWTHPRSHELKLLVKQSCHDLFRDLLVAVRHHHFGNQQRENGSLTMKVAWNILDLYHAWDARDCQRFLTTLCRELLNAKPVMLFHDPTIVQGILFALNNTFEQPALWQFAVSKDARRYASILLPCLIMCDHRDRASANPLSPCVLSFIPEEDRAEYLQNCQDTLWYWRWGLPHVWRDMECWRNTGVELPYPFATLQKFTLKTLFESWKTWQQSRQAIEASIDGVPNAQTSTMTPWHFFREFVGLQHVTCDMTNVRFTPLEIGLHSNIPAEQVAFMVPRTWEDVQTMMGQLALVLRDIVSLEYRLNTRRRTPFHKRVMERDVGVVAKAVMSVIDAAALISQAHTTALMSALASAMLGWRADHVPVAERDGSVHQHGVNIYMEFMKIMKIWLDVLPESYVVTPNAEGSHDLLPPPETYERHLETMLETFQRVSEENQIIIHNTLTHPQLVFLPSSNAALSDILDRVTPATEVQAVQRQETATIPSMMPEELALQNLPSMAKRQKVQAAELTTESNDVTEAKEPTDVEDAKMSESPSDAERSSDPAELGEAQNIIKKKEEPVVEEEDEFQEEWLEGLDPDLQELARCFWDPLSTTLFPPHPVFACLRDEKYRWVPVNSIMDAHSLVKWVSTRRPAIDHPQRRRPQVSVKNPIGDGFLQCSPKELPFHQPAWLLRVSKYARRVVEAAARQQKRSPSCHIKEEDGRTEDVVMEGSPL